MDYLKIISFALVCIRLIYWFIGERLANKAIPKAHPINLKGMILSCCTYGYWFFFCAQLLGLHIMTFPHNEIVQLIGFAIYITGHTVGILGRTSLGNNWSHGSEYQIKPNQALVTSGIYRYIRHPIYAGFLMIVVGGQLVVESYLVIPFTLLCYVVMHSIMLKEEHILTAQFGKQYSDYMIHTSRIFPGIS